MELIYFSDISQLDYVILNNPDLLRGMHPMTGDMVVAFELERMGIEFIDEWKFINEKEIENNWDDAHVLSKSWWNENVASTAYDGFALTDAAQQDLIYPLWASLNARTIYSKIFNGYPINKISGYFLPSIGVVRTGPVPTSRAVTSVSQAVLFYFADGANVAVDHLSTNVALSTGSQHLRVRSLPKADASIIKSASVSADKVVVVYETGMGGDEHTKLMENLHSLAGVRAISISQRVLEQILHINAQNNLEVFWECFVESTNSYLGPYPEIFANKYLLFQFERIKSEMEFASSIGDIFTSFLETINPSLVIFGHEAFTTERVLVRLAQNRKIQTLALVHGGFGLKFGYRGTVGDADIIAVWNDIDIEGLTSYGINKNRLNKIGVLRYEDKFWKYVSGYGIDSLKNKCLAKTRIGLCQDSPLISLITAEINTGLASPVADPIKHREALRGFLSFVESRPDLQFVIKAHPSYDYYELYRRLIDSSRPNLFFLEQISLDFILEASDICLMINYCTTAALEAMLMHVPVVYFDNAVYPLPDWQDGLSEGAMQRITTMSELASTVDALLIMPNENEFFLREVDNQIKRVLDLEDKSVINRMLDLVKCQLDIRATGHLQVLSNAEKVRDIILSNINQTTVLREHTSTYSVEYRIFTLAYLSGAYNIGFAILKQMAKTPRSNISSFSRQENYWSLLPSYISGRINNIDYSYRRPSVLWLFHNYLFCPMRFISAPLPFRMAATIYLGKRIFGHSASSKLIRLIHTSKKLLILLQSNLSR
jgi:hypothetical protein